MELSRIFPLLLVGTTILFLQPEAAKAISSAEVAQIAQSITVKLENPGNREQGSGIIIKKDGDTYYVLTAFHVVEKTGKYTLIAPDEQEYQINYQTVKKGEGVDLAILQFTSSKTYKVAKIGNSDKSTLGTISYVAGFPAPTAAFPISMLRFLEGKITANASRPIDGGYAIVYSNNTLGGMSGGPVFNEQGEVIAIHGRAETVSDGDKSNPKTVSTGNNLGIPINSFVRLAMVDVGVKAPVALVATAPKADDFYLQGNQKYQKGNYQGAIEDYNKAIAINPKYTQAYHLRGLAYFFSGNNQKAISDFSQVLTLKPQYTGEEDFYPGAIYFSRAEAYENLGDYQKAISDYNRIIALYPKETLAYIHRANAYLVSGDYQKAISDYNRSITLDRKDSLSYFQRGLAYLLSGDYQKAISDCNRVLALIPIPKNPEVKELFYHFRGIAYHLRADAYSYLGDNHKASSDYNRAIAQYEVLLAVYSKLPFPLSSIGSIQTNIGLIKYERGDIEGAIERWQEAISINSKEVKPQLPQLPQLALAVALYTKGDRSGSLRLGTMALRADKRYGNLQFLKTNLRGKHFLKDTAKFFKEPSIQKETNID
jgi:tetratricopeptide (TPR) repeat protein